jgi:hypothetical protein
MDIAVVFRGIERLIISSAGLSIIIVGLFLFKWGLSGAASIVVQAKSIKFQLLNASPGVIVVLFGTFLLYNGYSTRLEVKFPANEAQAPGEILFSRPEMKDEIKDFLKDCHTVSLKDSTSFSELKTLINIGGNIYKKLN